MKKTAKKTSAKKPANAVVKLPLGDRSYEIHIGPGALSQLAELLDKRFVKKTARAKLAGSLSAKRAFLIADECLTQARAFIIKQLTESGWEVHEIPVRAGESLKEMESVYGIYGALLKARANRDSVILALGGGTVGDAVGFVASTYMRGVKWVGIPSTLLAQVDSSVGGKTGINHPQGKNLIGTVYQPSLVVTDTNLLATLDRRDIASGLAEIFKCALILDSRFFAYLVFNADRFLALDAETVSRSTELAVAWKAKTVAKDEFDRKGVREVLNFGHTFGHALETATGFEFYRHGEAVLWGMRFALALSQVRKTLKAKISGQVDDFLSSIPCPPLPKGFGPGQFLERMKLDKKIKDGRTRFVLLKDIGKTVLDNNVSANELTQAFEIMIQRETARHESK